MYAVFKTGGKQYRATTGDVLKIEKIDAEQGSSIELDQVLMVGEGEQVQIGSPYLDGGKVTATVVEHGRGDKIRIIKFKRRKHYRRQMGHRQYYTAIEITGMEAGSGAKPAKKKAIEPKPAAKPEKQAKPAAAAAKFLAEPQGQPDDLKKISGVGPVLEGKLNDLGIFHYQQIAEFTPEQISQVDDALSFKGRVKRDNWLEQAAKLAAAGSQEEE